MKKVIVVAHPDDEVLFFSSLLEKVDKVIICFGPSSDKNVTEGRKVLQNQYPLVNIKWLNINESDTFFAANWRNPNITPEGLGVRRNEHQYQENFIKLVEIFKKNLIEYDEVFTHNPWGEYGHEEHVSVFKAVCSAMNGTKTNVYVSSYISDRSKILFDRQKHLLESEIVMEIIPKTLCGTIKHLYIHNDCWTWHDDYAWPNFEVFIKVKTCSSNANDKLGTSTANPPVMLFTKSFKQSFPRRVLVKLLPKRFKQYLKKVINRVA